MEYNCANIEHIIGECPQHLSYGERLMFYTHESGSCLVGFAYSQHYQSDFTIPVDGIDELVEWIKSASAKLIEYEKSQEMKKK